MDSATIPAQPGYYLLNVTYADDSGPTGFDKTPIIAWHVVHATPYPIGDADALGDAVMRPDGTVYLNGERPGEAKYFEDEATALQHFIYEYRKYT